MWGAGRTSASSRTEGVMWHAAAAIPSFADLHFTSVLLWACFITIMTSNHISVCSDTVHCGYRHTQRSGQSHEHGFILYHEPTHTTADSTVNPLTPELNPSEQCCLPRFLTGDFKFQCLLLEKKKSMCHRLFLHNAQTHVTSGALIHCALSVAARRTQMAVQLGWWFCWPVFVRWLSSHKIFFAPALGIPTNLRVGRSWLFPASSMKFLTRRSLKSWWVYFLPSHCQQLQRSALSVSSVWLAQLQKRNTSQIWTSPTVTAQLI